MATTALVVNDHGMDSTSTEPPSPDDPTTPTAADAAAAPPPAPSPPPASSTHRAAWYRSSTERVVAGVCGGLAERFGLPAILVRATFVVFGIMGVGLPIYVLAWVLLPNDRGERLTGRSTGMDLVAVGALAVAGLLMLDQVGNVAIGPMVVRSIPWLMILAGLAIVMRRVDPPRVGPERGGHAQGGSTPAGFGAPVPPPPPGFVPTAPAAPLMAPPMPRPPRERPVVGPLTWCAALLVIGAMGLASLAGNTVLNRPGVMAAAALIVFGAGLTLSSVRGHARGLLLPILALGGILGLLATLDIRAASMALPRDRTISSEATLPSAISASVGSATIDLTDLDLSSDRTLRVTQTAGSLRIALPTVTRSRVVLVSDTASFEVERPSAMAFLDSNPSTELSGSGNLPRDGEIVEEPFADWVVDEGYGASYSGIDDVIDDAAGSLSFGPDNGPTLTLEIDLGIGSVALVDLRWTDTQGLQTPVQLCAVGGGPRGVVQPCSEVPATQRVALCLNDLGYAVDCREDRPGTVDFPRIAACRSWTGSFLDCAELGITPVGAELVSTSGDTESDGTEFDGTEFDDTDSVQTGGLDPADLDRSDPNSTETEPAEPAVPDGTIAPPTPPATVPAPDPADITDTTTTTTGA